MTKSENMTHWDDVASNDVNLSSVIDPNDKSGLKIEYVNQINKRSIESEILNLPTGAKILDFGCGVGRISQWEAFSNHQYIGIDRSPKMIEAARNYFGNNKKLDFISYTGEVLPIENNSIDCIIAIWVLQHILDDSHLQNLLHEFTRILKTNGKIILIEQTADVEYHEPLKNGAIYKKHRTVERYIQLLGEKYSFIQSKKTDGLLSHGLFYKTLNVFSRFHLSFLKYFMGWFIIGDRFYYLCTSNLNILKPKWIDTFILFSKKN